MISPERIANETPLTWTYFSPEVKRTDSIGSVLFLAKRPGPGNTLSEIAKSFLEKGIAVSTGTYANATDIFNTQLEHRGQYIPFQNQPPDWIMSCADDDDPQIVDQLIRIKKEHPLCRIALVEDYPGVLGTMVKKLEKNTVYPDIIFTTSVSEKDPYTFLFSPMPKGKEPPLIIPIGQASFDEIRREHTAEVKNSVREKLHIPKTAKVLSFIGIPDNDYPNLNSETLTALAHAFEDIARTEPQEQFTIIYRPHGRETDERIKHPALLALSDKKKSNLRIITYDKDNTVLSDSSDIDGIYTTQTTREICAASDIVATIHSTVGTLAAIANGRQHISSELISVPLHILLSDKEQTKKAEASGTILPLVYKATLVCRDEKKLSDVIKDGFFNPEIKQTIIERSHHLANMFRIKGPTGMRPYLWMKWLERKRKQITEGSSILNKN